jgi:hypothetical protein
VTLKSLSDNIGDETFEEIQTEEQREESRTEEPPPMTDKEWWCACVAEGCCI